MKKMYVFCLNGIVHAVNEDGESKMTGFMYGFIHESKEVKEKFLINQFNEFIKEFKKNYTVVSVISENNKKELSLAIKKLIDNVRGVRPASGDVEYWEEALIYSIIKPFFDTYNKDIWGKISL